jgi:cysteine desulfurase
MIYLDNNATTSVAPEVLESMLPWLGEHYGNPSGGYRFGRQARAAIDQAKEQVASLIGAHPEEIIFTSCGTESNNTALRSSLAMRPQRKAILTSTVEHSAVDEVVKFLGESGHEGRFVEVDSEGHLDVDAWKESLADDQVVIASLIWANNETGVLSRMKEAAELAAKRDVYFHTDAVQAVGKIAISVKDLPIHALSMSAHKFHGPKGVGALFQNRHTRFQALLLGGGQEEKRRSGTENVAGIVGMGVAAELAAARIEHGNSVSKFRDLFESEVLRTVEGSEVNGDRDCRLPNTTNLYFPDVDGEGLLILLDEVGICCSPGSACSTGSVKPSRILKAMGQSSSRARGSVRFSLSHLTTEGEVVRAVSAIETAVEKLKVVLPSGGGRVVRGSSPE